MDCSLITQDLIAYHLATLLEVERTRVETHLVECTACLRAYIALKAHVDRVDEPSQPSEAVFHKLRAAVGERFRLTPARRARRWLVRPVPLYQGLGVAAVILLGTTLGPRVHHRLERRATDDIVRRVDTSRTTAESLSIY